MFCAISGKTPQEPVVSAKSGHVFEKSLIEKWLAGNNGLCPVTKQPLENADLIEVKVSKTVVPRPTTATSIPSLLQLFQNEWDAVMLETFTLKQQLETVRQELAHALYQHDAACRVIARLTRERDEARNALANLSANGVSAPEKQESMEVENALPNDIVQTITSKSQELSKERKKRTISQSLATADDVKEYDVLSSVNLHKTTSPGITSMDLHHNQNLVLTGGNDGEVILFNRADNRILATVAAHSKKVTDVDFHPTRDVFVSASADKTVKIWEGSGANWKSTHTIKTHQGEVTAVQVHPFSELLLTGSVDKTWALHDIHTGAHYVSVPCDSPLSALSFHLDGSLLGTGHANSNIRIWDIKNQKNAATFEGHKGKVTDIAFSENGYYCATSAEDNVVKIWDLRKLKAIESISLPEDFAPTTVEFDYSGTYLAVAGREVRVFAGKTFSEVASYGKHSSSITDLKWTKDAHNFLTVSLDRSLKLWGKKQ